LRAFKSIKLPFVLDGFAHDIKMSFVTVVVVRSSWSWSKGYIKSQSRGHLRCGGHEKM